jgi:hypothetical protein
MKPLLVLRNLKIDGTELWFKSHPAYTVTIVNILPETSNYTLYDTTIDLAIDEYVKKVPDDGWYLAHIDKSNPTALQIARTLENIYKKKLEA